MGASGGTDDAGRSIRSTLAHLRGGGRGWLLLVVAAGWLFMNGFRILLPAVLPSIKVEFAVGNTEAGFALTVLWLLYATTQFPAGVAADRWGERPWLVAGALLAAASFGAFYLAPVFGLFLAAAAVFGVGAGLFGTPRDMLVSRTFPRADNTAYGVVFAAGSVGAAALPFLATAIAARWGWRVSIVWLLPPLLLVGVGVWWAVPARPETDGDRPSALETARRALAALLAPRVAIPGVVFLLFVFTYQGLLSFLPTYLVERKGLSPELAAALFGLLFVVGAVVNPAAGSLADRFGERATMLGVIGVATLLLAALPFTAGVAALSLLVPLLGVRVAIGPLLSAFIVRELPPAVQGTGWGLIRTLFFGLGATGSTVVGLFADAGRFDAGFLLLAALTGAMAALWLLVPSPGLEAT